MAPDTTRPTESNPPGEPARRAESTPTADSAPTADSTPTALEALFLRWRSTGDAEALSEILARTDDELLPIARRHARDEHEASDLLQRTWLTVISNPERWDDRQRLLPWLVGILSIEVRRARRDAARVPDPERVAAREPEPVEVRASESEIVGLVRAAVAELQALYRVPVEMHLAGHSHEEIAARTGRARGTVRVQVFRGLEQLRRLLPTGLSLGVALAAFGSSASAAHLAPVLDAAARRTPAPTPAAAGGAAAAVGSALVPAALVRWLAGLAVAALVVTGAWYAAQPADPERRTAEQAALAPASTPEPGSPDAAPAAPGAAMRVPAAAAAAQPAPARGVLLVGRVEGLDGLAPAAPTITVRTADPRVTRQSRPAASAAAFEVDLTDWYASGGPSPRELLVEYDHAGALPARASIVLDEDARAGFARAAGARERVEIAVHFALVAPAARAHGRLVGATPGVAGLFEVDAAGEPAAEPVEGMLVRADGSFALRAARAGRHRLVLAAIGSEVRPADLALDLVAGEDRDAGVVALDPGVRIDGVVLAGDAPAATVPHVVRWAPLGVRGVRALHGVPLSLTARGFERGAGTVPVAADGAFAIAGLAPGVHTLSVGCVADAPGVLVLPDAATAEREVVAPARALVLESDAPLTTVRIVGPAGALAGARLVHADEGGTRRATTTDARGEARICGATPGGLSASHADFEERAHRFEGPVPGGTLILDLVPDAGRGSVRLVAAEPVDWSGATAVLVPLDADAADPRAALTAKDGPASADVVRTTVGADGTLAARVRAGRHAIRVEARRDVVEGVLGHARPWIGAVEVDAGGTVAVEYAPQIAGRLRIGPVAARGGADVVALELVDADGRRVPLALTSLVQRGDGRHGRRTTTDALPCGAHGTSDLLAPGSYELRATLGGSAVVRPLAIANGRTTVVELF